MVSKVNTATSQAKPDLQQGFNYQLAQSLREIADRLAAQGANPFRVNAYRHAASTVQELPVSVRELVDSEGVQGLLDLPNIGRGIASTILEILRTGSTVMLDRLNGQAAPERVFGSVPGIGPVLADRIFETLHIDTLPALEAAALDGRLEQVEGIGKQRARTIGLVVESMLRHSRVSPPANDAPTPSIATLLEVDAAYRRGAADGTLERIAPLRFNPEGKAWLPVLHTQLNGFEFTALFSNTARAHELGHTHDWVVLYFYDSDHHENQCTVVTEYHGPLKGRRVVRGREADCKVYYQACQSL